MPTDPAPEKVAALAALRAKVLAERDALPEAVLNPGELLYVRKDTGGLLTEVQRGSLRGQSAALSWVLGQIDAALAASDEAAPESRHDEAGR